MAQCNGKARRVPREDHLLRPTAFSLHSSSGSRGASGIGCLLTLIIGILVGYVLVRVIKVEQRFFEMRAAVHQEAVDAKDQTDERIILNLQEKARELGLPARAQGVFLNRGRDSIYVTVRWADTLSFGRLEWVRNRVAEAKVPVW